MEIELKLACHPNALLLFEEKVVPNWSAQHLDVKKSHAHLYNDYYDTSDGYFVEHKMGCRVRAKNQEFEQTIKTKGEVQGGLHQRPEYNVKLDENKPNLSLFPKEIWPENTDINYLNERIDILFSTHFERTTFLLTGDDFALEVVFDFGEVKRLQESLPICEIELELIKGEPTILFDFAAQIVEHIPARLSDVTKAARGYLLVSGKRLETKSLPHYLRLQNDETTEQAFCKALSKGLAHWQYHQQVYMQSRKLQALYQIRESILLLLQTVALYLPVLQCDELLSLHRQLLRLSQAWAWQEQLQCIQELRAKNGPFSRRIPKSQNLMNYLLGRREGLLNAHKPKLLNMSTNSVKVQLAISHLLYSTPWRSQITGTDLIVKKHANAWLSQSWQTLQQALPQESISLASMDDKQYLAIDILLRQALVNGYLLAELFTETRGNFRDPWLDLASGIKELKALKFLHGAVDDLNFEDQSDLNAWIEDKTHSVIKVMEQTREVAMRAEVYW